MAGAAVWQGWQACAKYAQNRSAPPTMPEFRTGGSKTDMVSSARKQDSTKRRLLRAPRLVSQKEGRQAMPGLNRQ